MALTRAFYQPATYRLNDFLLHVGSVDLVLASAKPEPLINSTTLLTAFDIYIWTFLCISVIAVTVTMVAIEKISAMWTAKLSIHQCM